MPTVLVTGSNRGLGLEFVKEYLKDRWHVLATCRDLRQADSLRLLQKDYPTHLEIFSMDVTRYREVDEVSLSLKDRPIDVLINNAGIYIGKGQCLGGFNYKEWEEILRVNLLAPMKVTEALYPQLRLGELKRIVMISSKMGSITDNTSGGSYLYRSSKSALNAAARSLAWDLREDGMCVLLLHPGWVKTDMGGKNASITPRQSVEAMRDLIHTLPLEKTGCFFDYQGKKLGF